MALLPALALSAGLLASTAEDVGPKLDELIPRLMVDGDVPGVSAALVKDGRVVWHGAYGVLDAGGSAKVADDTVFEAASLSKPVFAYAVLKLVDQKRIDLDTPLVKYLPGDFVEDPRAGLVTARRVLSHTTGFPNWRPPGQPLAMHFSPGERFSYSGEGFGYLQKVVERVTERPLESLMRTLVFEPLEMKSSSYVWQERYEKRSAAGHDAVGNPHRIRRPTEAHAAATLHTTALDYARFLAAALDGAGLSRSTAAEMIRAQIHVDEACFNCVARAAPGKLSKEIAWGLGWGLQETADGLSIWHWGDNNNEYHCFVIGYPARRLGLVVFTNSGGGHGIIPEIVAAALGGAQPAIGWLHYDRYDAPARTFYRDVLERRETAVRAYRAQRTADPGSALTEDQMNRVGYWLMAKKRLDSALAVFQMNAEDFPSSWNAHDSLAEAYAAAGRNPFAILEYKKSLELNPANVNGVEALKKLKP